MAFNALHALIFCVNSVDIHGIEYITSFDPLYDIASTFWLITSLLFDQFSFHLKLWKAQNQGFYPVSTVLTLPVYYGS